MLAGRAKRNFGTTSKLIRELAYRLGKRLDDRKGHYHFVDICSIAKSNRQAFVVHFGRLEDRNAPRIRADSTRHDCGPEQRFSLLAITGKSE